MLLKRPREYVQLHRDSTVQSLQYQTVLDGGVIRYVDSPMLRAIQVRAPFHSRRYRTDSLD